jgi:hypothetical protein
MAAAHERGRVAGSDSRPTCTSDGLSIRLPAEKPESVNLARPTRILSGFGPQTRLASRMCTPHENPGGRHPRTGRVRSGDRAGPSVEVAGKAADVATSDAAHWIDGQIAGAAVGAAIGSAGGCRAAPQAAGRHASARDRHGRGTGIQFLVLTGRASRGHMLRSTRRRDPGSLVTVRIMRTGARLLVSYPERWRERVALYRRFASADHRIMGQNGRFVKCPVRRG